MSIEKTALTAFIYAGVAFVAILWLVAWITGVTQREINEFSGEKRK